MFKTFIVGTVAVVVLAASATGSLRAEAVTNASPAGTAFAQDVRMVDMAGTLSTVLWILPLCLSWLVEGVQMGRSLFFVRPVLGNALSLLLKRARQLAVRPNRCSFTMRASALAKINDAGQLSVYWITSSALAINVGGTSRPCASAVFRLITNANLVACSTGRWAGFLPLRMRST